MGDSTDSAKSPEFKPCFFDPVTADNRVWTSTGVGVWVCVCVLHEDGGQCLLLCTHQANGLCPNPRVKNTLTSAAPSVTQEDMLFFSCSTNNGSHWKLHRKASFSKKGNADLKTLLWETLVWLRLHRCVSFTLLCPAFVPNGESTNQLCCSPSGTFRAWSFKDKSFIGSSWLKLQGLQLLLRQRNTS